jgi:ribonuclease H2 subunit A
MTQHKLFLLVAKVVRDSVIESWKWSEVGYEPEDGSNYGSGYPSDPKCKSWMEKNMLDPYFCFPDFVRFSWAPVKNMVDDRCCHVEWEADAEYEDDISPDGDSKQTSMQSFLVFKLQNDKDSIGLQEKR